MVWNYSTNLYIVKLHLFLTSAFFDSKKQDFSSLKFLGSSFVYDLSRLLKFLPSDIPEERKCIRYDLYSYSAQPTHLFVFKLVSTDDWVGLSSQRRGGVRKIDQFTSIVNTHTLYIYYMYNIHIIIINTFVSVAYLIEPSHVRLLCLTWPAVINLLALCFLSFPQEHLPILHFYSGNQPHARLSEIFPPSKHQFPSEYHLALEYTGFIL